MVKALIDISSKTNKVLGIIKAEYGLKTKSQAMNLIAEIFYDEALAITIRPKYAEKAKKIMSEYVTTRPTEPISV